MTDLDDLDDSVTVVETDPSRYGLSVEEVRRRRGFVEQVRDQVEDLRDSTTKTYDSHQVSFLCLSLQVHYLFVVGVTEANLSRWLLRREW